MRYLLSNTLLIAKILLSISWTSPLHNRQSRNTFIVRFSSEAEAGDEIKPKAEYGVSYIGGDPCGSKYNSDPFDTKVSKPGMPDDMKARIQALAEKKLKEKRVEE